MPALRELVGRLDRTGMRDQVSRAAGRGLNRVRLNWPGHRILPGSTGSAWDIRTGAGAGPGLKTASTGNTGATDGTGADTETSATAPGLPVTSAGCNVRSCLPGSDKSGGSLISWVI